MKHLLMGMLLLIALAAVLPIGATAAVVNNTVDVSALTDHQCIIFACDSQHLSQPGPISLNAFSGVDCPATCTNTQFAIADGQVAPGVVKVLAEAHGGVADVTAVLVDNVTLNVPGAAVGTPGSFTAPISIQGKLIGAVAGGVSADIEVAAADLTTGEILGHFAEFPEVGGGFNLDLATGVFPVTFNFQSGVPFRLGMKIQTHAVASLDEIPVSADLSHSLDWGGITNVMVNNAPVSGFTVTSDSGTDWSQSFIPAAVETPEPGTAMLLGGALGAVWLVRRRGPAATGLV